MVTSPTETVLIKLNSKMATQKAENASTTVIPKMLPPYKNAKVGKIKKRLATSATPVARKQALERVISTVFSVFL